jgi:hypothetical protein
MGICWLLAVLIGVGLADPVAAAIDERRFLPPERGAEIRIDGVVEALVAGHTLVVRRDDGRRVEVRLMGLGGHADHDPGRVLVEGRRVRLFADPARRDPTGRMLVHAEHEDGTSVTIGIALARANLATPGAR